MDTSKNLKVFHLIPLNRGNDPEVIVWADNEDDARKYADIKNNTLAEPLTGEKPITYKNRFYSDDTKCTCEILKNFELLKQNTASLTISANGKKYLLTKNAPEIFDVKG